VIIETVWILGCSSCSDTILYHSLHHFVLSLANRENMKVYVKIVIKSESACHRRRYS